MGFDSHGILLATVNTSGGRSNARRPIRRCSRRLREPSRRTARRRAGHVGARTPGRQLAGLSRAARLVGRVRARRSTTWSRRATSKRCACRSSRVVISRMTRRSGSRSAIITRHLAGIAVAGRSGRRQGSAESAPSDQIDTRGGRRRRRERVLQRPRRRRSAALRLLPGRSNVLSPPGESTFYIRHSGGVDVARPGGRPRRFATPTAGSRSPACDRSTTRLPPKSRRSGF